MPIPAELITELLARRPELHADLAGSLTGGEHRVLKDAGQMIPYQRLDAVVRSVRDVVSAIHG